jgi:hypothetical protein
MYGSNAQRSKNAADASKKAKDAEDGVSSSDPESYQRAASAHYSASYANDDAGNATKAGEHRKAAKGFQEKADSHYRAKSFAEGESRSAEALSRSAGLAGFGKDPNDARSAAELHADAATAHERASKAHELAHCDRDAAYHAAKAVEHKALAKKAKGDEQE